MTRVARGVEPSTRSGVASQAQLRLSPRLPASTDWQRWLEVHHTFQQRFPLSELIVGGADQVPCDVQAFMDVASAAGRIAFADLDDLRAYVHKLLRLEANDAPVRRAGVVFAPDAGHPDPTYFSRHQMAEPIAATLEERLGARVTRLFADGARKDALLSAGRSRPALLYCASHGAVAIETATPSNAALPERVLPGLSGNGDAGSC